MINPYHLPSTSVDNLKQLPEIMAVYFVMDASANILYIGKTTNLKNRWINHHRHKQLDNFEEVLIAYLEVSDRQSLDRIESILIRQFKPELNRTHIFERISNRVAKKAAYIKRMAEILERVSGSKTMELGFKAMRLKKGITQMDAANALGIHLRSYQRMEDGEVKSYSIKVIEELCKLFSCHPNDLFIIKR